MHAVPMIKVKVFSIVSLLGFFGVAAGIVGIDKPVYSAPIKVSLSTLSGACRAAVNRNRPSQAERLTGPRIYVDMYGDMSIGWSSDGVFYANENQESRSAEAINKACPSVVVVTYSGSTGGSERWYMRRTGFTVRHSRDSGMPGDKSKYWKWDSMPFDYDPGRVY